MRTNNIFFLDVQRKTFSFIKFLVMPPFKISLIGCTISNSPINFAIN